MLSHPVSAFWSRQGQDTYASPVTGPGIFRRKLPTEVLLAQSMVSKFGAYLPFYHPADIDRRYRVNLGRSILAS